MLQSYSNPGLKAILADASHALAQLDAGRLDQLVRYCATLFGEAESEYEQAGEIPERDASAADREMATFASVLEATRANLQVMRRLREIGAAQLEYGPALAGCDRSRESEHGDH